MLGLVLDVGDIVMTETDKTPALMDSVLKCKESGTCKCINKIGLERRREAMYL